MKKHYFVLLAFLLLFSLKSFAQGATCEQAEPFCAAGGTLLFPNTTGVPSSGSLACLGSIPNPAWFYLQIAEPGLLEFEILQNSSFDANGNPNGTSIDVDFAVWGPFASVDGNCAAILDGSLPAVDCSFSAAAIEEMTIPNAQVGEIYIVLITNYTFTMPGTAGFIRLTQTNLGDPGTGSTDCSIILNDIICEGGFFIIEAIDPDGSNYQWFVYNEVTEVFDILTGETNPTLEVDESGLYRVEYLDSLGVATEDEIQVTLTVLPLPELTFNDPLLFCEDEDIIIDAMPTNIDDLEGVTYTWFYNGVEIVGETSAILNAGANNYGIYTVEIEQTIADCGISVDIEVIAGILLETNLPMLVAICENEELPALDATPTNGGIDLSLVTYSWLLDGVEVSQEAIYTPSSAGIYTVIINYDICSEITVDIEVNIQDLPTLELGIDEVFCDGDSFEIQPIITGNTPDITYLWSTGQTTSTITVNTTGTYELQITDGSCVVTDTITITFGDFPQVDINDTIFSCPNEMQLITATSSISDVTYVWFKNGVEITGETAATIEILIDEGVVNTPIIYNVEVSSNGCITTAEVEVRAYPNNANCVISQGLSPGGSIGLNDNFDLSFLAARTGIANLQIFSRHGRTVYERSNYTNEWTGDSKDGNQLPTGTYYYVITFSGEDSVYGTQKTGWIYINRDAN